MTANAKPTPKVIGTNSTMGKEAFLKYHHSRMQMERMARLMVKNISFEICLAFATATAVAPKYSACTPLKSPAGTLLIMRSMASINFALRVVSLGGLAGVMIKRRLL